MKARMGASRTLGLVAIAAMTVSAWGLVTAPSANAGPVLPGPDSSTWLPLQIGGHPATDPVNDAPAPHLDLTPAGGALGTATAFLAADLDYAYFRFHVAAQPGVGGYVVQFDTNDSSAGWERALRYDPTARTVTLYTGGTDTDVKTSGTPSTPIPATQTAGTSYDGADGGAFVAFAVPRPALTAAGISLGGPMVIGATTEDGVGFSHPLVGTPKAEVLGTGKFSGLGGPSWNALDTDPIAIDSDGDGVPDKDDDCPVDYNPVPAGQTEQPDDDKALDNSLPPDPALHIPDGTEGLGNACDPTPRGYDSDGDGVGYLDDDCKERPGIQANGCPATDSTVAVLRYKARTKTFKGTVRGSQYDECAPRRGVTVTMVTPGPDRIIGTVRSDSAGQYSLKVTKKPRAGKYYAYVDRRTNFNIGLVCTAVKSPKIQVG